MGAIKRTLIPIKPRIRIWNFPLKRAPNRPSNWVSNWLGTRTRRAGRLRRSIINTARITQPSNETAPPSRTYAGSGELMDIGWKGEEITSPCDHVMKKAGRILIKKMTNPAAIPKRQVRLVISRHALYSSSEDGRDNPRVQSSNLLRAVGVISQVIPRRIALDKTIESGTTHEKI